SKDELAAGLSVMRKLDLDEDDTISAEELLREGNRPNYYEYGGRPAAPAPPDMPVLAVTPGEPLEPLCKRILARYDRNKDRKLSASEIGLDPGTFAALDTNDDGALDADELVGLFGRPPDLELQARLGPAVEKSGSFILQPLVELTKMASKKKLELVTPKEGPR